MLKSFFSTKGRLNRWQYFKRRIILGALLTLFISLGYRIWDYQFGQANSYAEMYNTIVSLLFIVPTFCLNVQRLHDMNKNATIAVFYAIVSSIMAFLDFTGFNAMLYVTLSLVTINFALGGYILIVPGTNGKNRFGEQPL